MDQFLKTAIVVVVFGKLVVDMAPVLDMDVDIGFRVVSRCW